MKDEILSLANEFLTSKRGLPSLAEDTKKATTATIQTLPVAKDTKEGEEAGGRLQNNITLEVSGLACCCCCCCCCCHHSRLRRLRGPQAIIEVLDKILEATMKSTPHSGNGEPSSLEYLIKAVSGQDRSIAREMMQLDCFQAAAVSTDVSPSVALHSLHTAHSTGLCPLH